MDTPEGGGFVHYLDCGDSLMGTYTSQNLSNGILTNCAFYCMLITSQLCLNLKKKAKTNPMS